MFLTELVNVTLQLDDIYQVLAVVNDGRHTRAGTLRFVYSFPFLGADTETPTLNYSTPLEVEECTNTTLKLITFTFDQTMLDELLLLAKDNTSDSMLEIKVCFTYLNFISRNDSSNVAYIKLMNNATVSTTTDGDVHTTSNCAELTTSYATSNNGCNGLITFCRKCVFISVQILIFIVVIFLIH